MLACREACPGRRRRSTWLSRVGRPQGHNRSTRPEDRPARGKDSELEHRFVPARQNQVADFGIEHLLPPRARKQSEGAREGWTTRTASQDPYGELLRPKRGAVPKEGVSGRGKPSLSRGAGEAISIPWAPRKPTCKGGSVTRGVTGRQRQSREWSGTAFWDRRPKRQLRPGARAKKTLLVTARPAEADPARRETTDPPIAPFFREWNQVGRKPGARVQSRKAVVGRSRSDASRCSCEITSV